MGWYCYKNLFWIGLDESIPPECICSRLFDLLHFGITHLFRYSIFMRTKINDPFATLGDWNHPYLRIFSSRLKFSRKPDWSSIFVHKSA